MKKAFRASRLSGCLVLLGLCAGLAAPAAAQPAGRAFGLGGQIGRPSGVTLKRYRPGPSGLLRRADAFTLLAAWDLEEVFFLNAHLLRERPIPESPLRYFYGPGLVLGFEDTRRAGLVLGVSGAFGVNFFRENFEVYLQITPRLNLFPNTHGAFDAGIGMRYYF
jgi:hypothetical protein